MTSDHHTIGNGNTWKGYSFPAGWIGSHYSPVSYGHPGRASDIRTEDAAIIGLAQVTDLSVWAIPGKLRAFTPKAPAVTPPEPPEAESTARAGGYDPRHQRILRRMKKS